jgi:signal transduction histidine kinase
MPEWLNQSIRDPRTYGGIVYLLLALPLGIAEFTFLVTALALGAGLAITLIGIPILIATVFAWRWVAQAERRLIGALTGRVIPDPYRPTPAEGSIWRRLQARLADPATWKDLVFLLLQFPLGALAFIVAAGVLSVGVAALLAPLTFWAIPDGIDVGVTVVDTLPEALVLGVLGAVLLLVGIPALAVLARGYGAYAELLLGSNADPVLTAQVSDLRDARSRIIEAADAERRRIERDLHDGAQQRLVALSLTLRMAEKRAEQGDPESAELVRSAGEEAGLALKELRDLARGIHPAIVCPSRWSRRCISSCPNVWRTSASTPARRAPASPRLPATARLKWSSPTTAWVAPSSAPVLGCRVSRIVWAPLRARCRWTARRGTAPVCSARFRSLSRNRRPSARPGPA